jgi:L-Ala-D/L-Glu epimerase
MSHVADLRFQKVVRPLRTTFATSLGHKRQMTSVLVTAVLDVGCARTGEVSTSFSFPQETVDAIASSLNVARRLVKGLAIDEWQDFMGSFRKRSPHLTMTASGLEVALFRAHLAVRGVTEYVHWGASSRLLQTDITIPLSDDHSAIRKWVDRAAAKGFTVYKLKVSGDRRRDETLLSSVHAALRAAVPGFRLRLDGNQGYSASGLLGFLAHIEKNGYAIELFEQPLPKSDFRGYEEVMRRRSVPIFLDESVCNVADAVRVIDNDLCDGINVKIAKTGVAESAAIVDVARRAGRKLMIGCMVETMVGLSAAIFLAAGTGAFAAVDLDSTQFLYGRTAHEGIEVCGPIITVV